MNNNLVIINEVNPKLKKVVKHLKASIHKISDNKKKYNDILYMGKNKRYNKKKYTTEKKESLDKVAKNIKESKQVLENVNKNSTKSQLKKAVKVVTKKLQSKPVDNFLTRKYKNVSSYVKDKYNKFKSMFTKKNGGKRSRKNISKRKKKGGDDDSLENSELTESEESEESSEEPSEEPSED